MPKYLVTGGAGFIGSHIAERLLKMGKTLVIVDNFSTGRKENIEHLQATRKQFDLIEGDLSDPKIASAAVKGVDVIFHEAALGSVPKSVKDPRATHHANITSTLELLIASKDSGVKCFVNAASSSAYGETPELPKREAIVPKPLSPYAVTKLAQEEYCHAFSASYGLKTVSLRYFNVFGPRQDPDSQYAAVIPKFFKSCLSGTAPEIFGDGAQTRDFTYIDDVVDANLAAVGMNAPRGEVFNIAGGKSITINELAKTIIKLVGADVKPSYLPPRSGDIRDSLADIQQAKRAFGYIPKVSLEVGLQRSWEWYRDHLPR